MINKEQVKMARAALSWGVRELAEKAGTTANTVSRFENGADAKVSTLEGIQVALESAGIVFIENGAQSLEGGIGIRLKEKT
ncbi:helix-turn-helix transcriptional regulator [Terasakiella sp. SH-1]|uniref:helix-turn-helix domain-containing protein n=1 Tax=Terasakiella sp. SH-1 TaxID=2560057 RepID=UPI001F101D87|nr:helix-turn-helix transcriptional regulator [Terasakiella sp. SH-1]